MNNNRNLKSKLFQLFQFTQPWAAKCRPTTFTPVEIFSCPNPPWCAVSISFPRDLHHGSAWWSQWILFDWREVIRPTHVDWTLCLPVRIANAYTECIMYKRLIIRKNICYVNIWLKPQIGAVVLLFLSFHNSWSSFLARIFPSVLTF